MWVCGIFLYGIGSYIYMCVCVGFSAFLSFILGNFWFIFVHMKSKREALMILTSYVHFFPSAVCVLKFFRWL